MTSLLLVFSFLSCVSSGAMLIMLLWLIAAYVLSAVWLITQGAVYSGLLYVLVYVGAIVVLIMFVVQLTNTSLTLNISTFTPKLVILQNLLLLVSFSFLLAWAYYLLNSELLMEATSYNFTDVKDITTDSLSETQSLEHVSDVNTLSQLAYSIFNEYGYVLILSVHAILLAVIGPIKLALADYQK